MNTLDQLKQFTQVVADTGDFNLIAKFKPIDATTNPSLILKATLHETYRHLIDDAVVYAKKQAGHHQQQLESCLDKLAVNFGMEILKIVPRRVSTEVDARLSFDTEGTLKKAHELISLYEENGISRSRILIKVASTWEGIKAAEQLEKEDIHCNLTLLFSKVQAIACAEAGVQLISPFVGRIHDWYKKERKVGQIAPQDDPGVHSVTEIYNYYKKFGYPTEVMGASFRNIGEIIELAGCDLLTISPDLLKQLEESEIEIRPKLTQQKAEASNEEKITLDEKTFRWMLNENAMATEKLTEGIRKFSSDLMQLEQTIAKML